MKFVTNNSPQCSLTIGYKDMYIEEKLNSKFLCLHLDNHLNWKGRTDQMIPKLSGASGRQVHHRHGLLTCDTM
jgi:hypothetical protein